MSEEIFLSLFGAGFLFVMFGVFMGIMTIVEAESTKSKKARKLVTDLYVIGTIRKFANADGIDLESEMKNLRAIDKMSKARYTDLDKAVEVNLTEKVDAVSQKNLDKLNEDANKQIEYKRLG